MNKKSLILICILGLALFLRVYQLNDVPPSPSLDEVSIGYNAYSLLRTGADEYGTKFPLLLRAYDDWRPALYVYLVIPFVKVLGLNILAVRLPSVLLSVLTVAVVYYLVKEIFKLDLPSFLPATVSFLLAISPWHIYLSRLGHEVNAGFAFFILALFFFFKKKIYLSTVFFVLSFASYQAEKIFIPIILVGLFFLFKKEIWAEKKRVIFAILLALILLFPFTQATLSPNALIRFKATSIFNANQEQLVGKTGMAKRLQIAKMFFNGYLSHFNPQWLFTNPSADRHKVPNLGLLYWWEAPLLIFGAFIFLRGQTDLKKKGFILLWFFLAPLAAAITTDAPHAMRSFTFLPVWQIFSGLGVISLFKVCKKEGIKTIFSVTLSLIIIFSLFHLFKEYFLVFPKTQSASFQYALHQTIPVVLENEKNYPKIIFSNKDNLYQSYMFFLFGSQYDPVLYQKQGGTVSGGFAETHQFGKFEFRPIDWPKEKKQKALYVGNVTDFPEETKGLAVFSYLNGQEAIKLVAP